MYLQFPAQIGITIALLVLSVAFVPGSHAQSQTETAQTSPVGIDYQALRKRVEQIETKDVYQLGLEALKQVIDTASTDLEAYIDANNKDVDAMILSVRLGFIKEIFVKNREKDYTPAIDPEDMFAALHRRLDKVLEIDSENAKANYWKARLYGMRTQVIDNRGNPDMRPIDLEKAIEFAEKAVYLDSSNAWYREALAVYHITNGDRKSALVVLDTPLTAYNPVNILLKDIDAFALPEGTVYLQKDTELYSELQIKQKTINDFPQLRSQVFAVPMAASRLEAFFQKHWSEFRFFKQGPNLFAQYLIFDPNLRPSRNIAEARAWVQKNQGGIILSVMDVKNPTAAEREMSPEGHLLPASLGDNFSYVFYVNNRKVE
jgi:tetratricopeptide (TPR) repeat protein